MYPSTILQAFLAVFITTCNADDCGPGRFNGNGRYTIEGTCKLGPNNRYDCGDGVIVGKYRFNLKSLALLSLLWPS